MGDVTMFKMATQQNIISLIILATCFVLMYATTPHASLEPHGIAYSLQPTYHYPILSEDQVRVTETPSDDAVAIGHVSAEIAFTANNSAAQQQALLDYVKGLSGKMGANELVINIFGSTPENIMVLRGYAFKSA